MTTGDQWLRDAVADHRLDHPTTPKGPDSRPAPGADQQLAELDGDLVQVVIDPEPTYDADGNLDGFEKPERLPPTILVTYPAGDPE